VPRPADERGYVVRKNVMEESTRPDYVIPVGSANGVWAMMKTLGRFRGEGWPALWKGPCWTFHLVERDTEGWRLSLCEKGCSPSASLTCCPQRYSH
jgi:hypothetical protein